VLMSTSFLTTSIKRNAMSVMVDGGGQLWGVAHQKLYMITMLKLLCQPWQDYGCMHIWLKISIDLVGVVSWDIVVGTNVDVNFSTNSTDVARKQVNTCEGWLQVQWVWKVCEYDRFGWRTWG
jgi:hypothetical protein